MLSFQLEGVEIDRCPGCEGTWLDSGELETLLEISGIEPGVLAGVLLRAPDGRRGKRRCPRCPRRLRKVTLEGAEPLEVDRCARGHGLWFDHGEMEELVERHAGGDQGAVGRFFEVLYHHEYEETN